MIDRCRPSLAGSIMSLHREAPSTPRLSHDQAADSTIIDGPAFWIQLKSSCCAVHIGEDTVTAVSGAPRDGEMHAVTATDVATDS